MTLHSLEGYYFFWKRGEVRELKNGQGNVGICKKTRKAQGMSVNLHSLENFLRHLFNVCLQCEKPRL